MNLDSDDLFTFVLEFYGGTYISQARARTPEEAMRKWGRELVVRDIKGLGDKTKAVLVEELNDEYLSPVKTVENVWCFCISPQGRFGIVHMIKTSSGQVPPMGNPVKMSRR
jgi:hypothetical protein